jgi:glycosyltransferase involved in cell wall biosynthesis
VRILFHCVYFPPEVGGLESHVYYLAKAMVRRGHEVSIVTSRSLPGVPAREEMEGIQIWRTWFPSRSPAGWVTHSVGSVPKTVFLARNADIIHAQAFASIPPCAMGSLVGGAPLLATFHTSHFLTRALRDGWRSILGRLVGIPDYSLAASGEIAQVAMGLAPGVSVEALANGVDTEFFCRTEGVLPRTERPRIMVPRRLFPKNGVEFFIRAFPAILKEMDVEAVLVGDGPERATLVALAESLGVSHRVTFLGKRPHEEMPGLLSSGELAVVPSLMEATSVAALEAMACELPVAASNVGGLPEIVGEDVGGLFPAGNPEALARAVVELLRDPKLREKGERARQKVVQSWSNERLVDRHLEIYNHLLQKRK